MRLIGGVIGLLGAGALVLLLLLRDEPRNQVKLAPSIAGEDVTPTPIDAGVPVPQTSQRRPPPPALPPRSNYTPEHDPANENYDNIKLALSTEPRVPWQIETRREPWATTREQTITTALRKHFENVRGNPILQHVECKMRTCLISMDIEEFEANTVLGQYPIMMMAPLSTVSGGTGSAAPGRVPIDFYLGFNKDNLEETDFTKFIEAQAQQHRPPKGQP